MTFPSDNFKELVRRIQAGEDPCKSICEVYGYFSYDEIINDRSLSEMADAIFGNHKNDPDIKKKNADKPEKKVMTKEDDSILSLVDNLTHNLNVEFDLNPSGGYAFVDNDSVQFKVTHCDNSLGMYASTSWTDMNELVSYLKELRKPVVIAPSVRNNIGDNGELEKYHFHEIYVKVQVQINKDLRIYLKESLDRLLDKIPQDSILTGFRKDWSIINDYSVLKDNPERVYMYALFRPSKEIRKLQEKVKAYAQNQNYKKINSLKQKIEDLRRVDELKDRIVA